MKIYLDMCSLQRPLDDQSQLRIHLEAEAILGALAFCESGQAELIGSVAHVFENERNSNPFRKSFAQEVLADPTNIIEITPAIEQRARSYNTQGIKALDALHLACAVEGKADYFCTCDDRFLRRAKQIDTEQTKVVSPIELIEEIDNERTSETPN